MHTGRVTEYVKVLANMFLETLCRYVCTHTHTEHMYAHTHTHIVVWFLVKVGKLQYGSLPVFMHWLQLFFLIRAPLHMVLDVWYNNIVADLV